MSDTSEFARPLDRARRADLAERLVRHAIIELGVIQVINSLHGASMRRTITPHGEGIQGM